MIYLDAGEATTASRLLQKAGRLKDSRRRKDLLSFKENENDKIENRVSRFFNELQVGDMWMVWWE